MTETEIKNLYSEKWGYSDYTVLPNQRDAAILKLAFTHAIVADLEPWGHGDRWCYSSYAAALMGLNEWAARGGEGEPIGWHRHPDTGRRREHGDPAKETINW
jgi:hypothetical protein